MVEKSPIHQFFYDVRHAWAAHYGKAPRGEGKQNAPRRWGLGALRREKIFGVLLGLGFWSEASETAGTLAELTGEFQGVFFKGEHHPGDCCYPNQNLEAAV